MTTGDSGTPVGGRHGEGTYQMLWDCKFCGTQNLLGVTHRHCPNCGAAQDPDARYFPAEDDMVALHDHQFVGADRVCPACQQPNSAASQFCSECGADLATGATVVPQAARDIGAGPATGDTRRDLVKEGFQAEMQRVGATPRGALSTFLGLRRREWLIFGAVALLALAVVGIIFALTYRQEVTGTVEALNWERTVEIEDYQPRTGSNWRDELPGDAYNLDCRTRQRGTRRVQTGSHQDCRDVAQGDGSFRRECRTVKEYRNEPVYDTWCGYRVDRWEHRRDAVASGEGKFPPPQWPAYSLSSGSGRYGQERVGDQDGDYRVIVREEDGDRHTCTFDDQARWDAFDVGASVTLEVGLRGEADCDTLKVGP